MVPFRNSRQLGVELFYIVIVDDYSRLPMLAVNHPPIEICRFVLHRRSGWRNCHLVTPLICYCSSLGYQLGSDNDLRSGQGGRSGPPRGHHLI
jgi:hypothetical protein